MKEEEVSMLRVSNIKLNIDSMAKSMTVGKRENKRNRFN